MSQSGVLHQKLPIAGRVETRVTREHAVLRPLVRLQESLEVALKIALIAIESPRNVVNPTLVTFKVILCFGLVAAIAAYFGSVVPVLPQHVSVQVFPRVGNERAIRAFHLLLLALFVVDIMNAGDVTPEIDPATRLVFITMRTRKDLTFLFFVVGHVLEQELAGVVPGPRPGAL